jgi:hypothetical protein
LSKVFQVSEVQINLIIRGKSWEHIPLPTWITPELQMEMKAYYRRERCRRRKARRVTPVMVQEMLEKRRQGWMVIKIARFYGLHQSWVSRILRGKAWSGTLMEEQENRIEIAGTDPTNQLAEQARIVLAKIADRRVLASRELDRLLDRLERITAVSTNERAQVMEKVPFESVPSETLVDADFAQ